MTDYNKMKKLLLLDNLDGNRKGINGMLTIKDTFGDMLILGIPNNNVRKQYYGYLLEQYQEEKFVDLTQMKILFTGMALEGKWRDDLETMAKAYEDVSSVRDGIESESSHIKYESVRKTLCLTHGFLCIFLIKRTLREIDRFYR